MLTNGPMVYTAENAVKIMNEIKTHARRLSGLNEINENPDIWELIKVTKLDVYAKGSAKRKFGAYFHSEKINPRTINIRPVVAPYQPGEIRHIAEPYVIEHVNITNKPITVGHYLGDDQKFNVELTKDEYSKFCARKYPWRPLAGRFMYKSLSRTFVRVESVRVERLQDIDPIDAICEGIELKGEAKEFFESSPNEFIGWGIQ